MESHRLLRGDVVRCFLNPVFAAIRLFEKRAQGVEVAALSFGGPAARGIASCLVPCPLAFMLGSLGVFVVARPCGCGSGALLDDGDDFDPALSGSLSEGYLEMIPRAQRGRGLHGVAEAADLSRGTGCRSIGTRLEQAYRPQPLVRTSVIHGESM